jgi:hypothetical protein
VARSGFEDPGVDRYPWWIARLVKKLKYSPMAILEFLKEWEIHIAHQHEVVREIRKYLERYPDRVANR